jgi:hypothetical protein
MDLQLLIKLLTDFCSMKINIASKIFKKYIKSSISSIKIHYERNLFILLIAIFCITFMIDFYGIKFPIEWSTKTTYV